MVAQLGGNWAGIQIQAILLQDSCPQPPLCVNIGCMESLGNLIHTCECSCHPSMMTPGLQVPASRSPFGMSQRHFKLNIPKSLCNYPSPPPSNTYTNPILLSISSIREGQGLPFGGISQTPGHHSWLIPPLSFNPISNRWLSPVIDAFEICLKSSSPHLHGHLLCPSHCHPSSDLLP